jgi:hypothetical protein
LLIEKAEQATIVSAANVELGGDPTVLLFTVKFPVE